MLRLSAGLCSRAAAQLATPAACSALQKLATVGAASSDPFPSRSLAGSARLDQQAMPAAAAAVAKEAQAEPTASYLL